MEKPQFETHTISDSSSLKELQSYIQDINPELIVVDVESDSEIDKKAKLYGIGICFRDNEAFYIPLRDNKSFDIIWSDQDLALIKRIVADFQNRKVIGHNVIYDVLVIKNNLSIDLTNAIYSDTLLQKHTLDEEPPFGLKPVSKAILGEWADLAENKLSENVLANGGKYTKESKEMYKADTSVLAEYCCWDVILTYKLFTLFEERLTKEGLHDLFYKEEIMPLYKHCTIKMRDKGFSVDVDYFNSLKSQLESEIRKLEDDIIIEISPNVEDFCDNLLEEEFPIKNTGNFPKALAEILDIPLPKTVEGKVTLAKKHIEAISKLNPEHEPFYKWVTGEASLQAPSSVKRQAQEKLFFEKYTEKRYIFNLKSNDHLIELLVNTLGYKTLDTTEKGKAKVDDDFIDSLKGQEPFIDKLIDYKKLNKLLSTYVEGILDRQIDGIVYTSMLQFGTTSGRYSSRDPNLQNIPRIKDEEAGLSSLVLKYTNAIKRGFIAPKGYKIVNADYSSLEPVCFAHVSNEDKLRDVFIKNDDLYSSVAINVFNVKNCSANKKDPNYLKNVHPELRQQAKVFCLAVVYGAEESRISEIMNVRWQQAHKIISDYLTAYPNLRKYMAQCNVEAKTKGFVKTQFGRVRHLSAARSTYVLYGDKILDYEFAKRKNATSVRREYKNALNNAKNFKIQGLAAHIVNRAMIATEKEFRRRNMDAYIVVQVHDEITCIVREDQAEEAAKVLKNCMENTITISVPLKAEPLISDNWADAK